LVSEVIQTIKPIFRWTNVTFYNRGFLWKGAVEESKQDGSLLDMCPFTVGEER
jgi:hypothetical protein